jgi:hypothetical protein
LARGNSDVVFEDDLIFSSADERAKFESSKLGANSKTSVTPDDSSSADIAGIGPALPPHLRQIQSPAVSSSDSIGPQLPPHLRQTADEPVQHEGEQHIEADAEKRKVDTYTDVTEAIAASSTHAEKRQRFE